jgi:hypothetical protein
MSQDPFDTESLNEARSKSIAKTIEPISVDDLKAIGEQLFPYLDHPWRQQFFQFVSDNANCTFHHATTHDGIEIFYCKDQNKGMWFKPGSGMGPLQDKGLQALQAALAKR